MNWFDITLLRSTNENTFNSIRFDGFLLVSDRTIEPIYFSAASFKKTVRFIIDFFAV